MKTSQIRGFFVIFFMLFNLIPALFAQDADKWFEFDPGDDPYEKDSAIDLSFLNESTAGQNGRILTRNGYFVHERTSQPVRFWAVSSGKFTEWDEAEWKDAAKVLSKRGVNLVRHHSGVMRGDSKGGLPYEVNENKLRGLWQAVGALKEEGVYSHLSLYFPLWVVIAKDDPKFPGYDGKTKPFMLHVLSDEYNQLYRNWWERVLTERNSYTNTRLADDPAVMGIELINEDSFFFWTFKKGVIPDEYMEPLYEKFGAWATHKYGSVEKALETWDAKDEDDDVAAGKLGIRHHSVIMDQRTLRDQDTIEFLAFVQRKWAADTIAWLRSIGYKGLVTVGNWHTSSAKYFGAVERWTYLDGDWIDAHAYFSSFTKGEESSWSMRNGHIFANRALSKMMPNNPQEEEIHYGVSWLVPIYNGKPTSVSETAWIRPNRYRGEAPLYYAVYGSLNSLDSVMHFAFDGGKWETQPRYHMQPWTLLSPTQAGQWPAAALIYRAGYIAEAEPVLTMNLSEKGMFALEGMPMPTQTGFDELRAQDIPAGGSVPVEGDFDPLLPLVGPVAINITKEGGATELTSDAKRIDREAKVVTSSTEEIKLDWGKGLMTFNAPKAQGVVGFIGENEPVELDNVAFQSPLHFAAMTLVSLDNQPLSSSRKMLLQVMAEEKNSGWEAKEGLGGVWQIISVGEDPWLAKELQGTVKFKGFSPRITTLDLNGYVKERLGSSDTLPLKPDVVYYLLER